MFKYCTSFAITCRSRKFCTRWAKFISSVRAPMLSNGTYDEGISMLKKSSSKAGNRKVDVIAMNGTEIATINLWEICQHFGTNILTIHMEDNVQIQHYVNPCPFLYHEFKLTLKILGKQRIAWYEHFEKKEMELLLPDFIHDDLVVEHVRTVLRGDTSQGQKYL